MQWLNPWSRTSVLSSICGRALAWTDPLLLLNVSALTLGAFFAAYAAFALGAAAACAMLYPDRSYDENSDLPRLSPLPSCCPRAGRARCRGVHGGELARQTCTDLLAAASDLRTWRFWGFCLTFSWGALTQEWAGSALGSGLLFPSASDAYLQYAVPLLANATYLVAPVVGWLIDVARHGSHRPRTLHAIRALFSPWRVHCVCTVRGRQVEGGFVSVSLLLVVSMQGVTLALWLGWRLAGGVASMQWLSLLLLLLLGGVVYSIEFAYLTMTFPQSSYPGLLTCTLAVQGSLGFVAWPVLSEVQPFGCADPCVGNFMTILVPSVALYAWPVWELATRRKRGRTGHGTTPVVDGCGCGVADAVRTEPGSSCAGATHSTEGQQMPP
jgi:hypothetical protein